MHYAILHIKNGFLSVITRNKITKIQNLNKKSNTFFL